jgi:N-acetylglutamate synthase/N-acetylornithine aminotransferase
MSHMYPEAIETAKELIRKVSDSTLVKTDMFGRDPSWGESSVQLGMLVSSSFIRKLTCILVIREN